MNTIKLNTLGDKVIVRKTADGGNEGGGNEGGSTFEYLDITNVTGMNGILKLMLIQVAYMGKVSQTIKVNNRIMKQGTAPIGSYMYIAGSTLEGSEAFTQVINAITAISIDFSTTINCEGQMMTISEIFTMSGMPLDIDAIPRITKEEFYNLES